MTRGAVGETSEPVSASVIYGENMPGSRDQERRGDEPEIQRIFSRRGTVEILRQFEGQEALRFGEIMESAPGIARQQINERLRELQNAGVMRREILQLGPPTYTEYTLTPLGVRLARIASKLTEVASSQLRHG